MFIMEPITEFRIRLETLAAVMVPAETKVLGPRWGADGKHSDQHWSQNCWEPFDEVDYEPEPEYRYIEVNPLRETPEQMAQFYAIVAECGAAGELALYIRSEATYTQAFIPPRAKGGQNFVRIFTQNVAADLQARISKARAILSSDGPTLARSAAYE